MVAVGLSLGHLHNRRVNRRRVGVKPCPVPQGPFVASSLVEVLGCVLLLLKLMFVDLVGNLPPVGELSVHFDHAFGELYA
jgi:hypothetical protein